MSNESVKSIEDWEKERSVLFTDKDLDVTQEISEDEMNELLQSKPYTGVHHAGRVEWLNKNGYEVTRENLADGSLESKPVEEEE